MEHLDAGSSGGFNLVNHLLFPAPPSNYDAGTFSPEELIWLPRSLDPESSDPQSNVPCLFLTSCSARYLMLYLHSNAEDLGGCYHFCNMLRLQFQVNVLAVEYPGYGLCPGRPDEESVTANALLGYRCATTVLGFPPEDIIVIGRSIGSGPALCIASQYPVYGLILICPFLSVREAVRTHVGRLADLIEERFPNKDRIRQVTASLLIVHGKKDTVVPWTHGEALYEASRRRKRLVTPEDMNHNASLLLNPGCFVIPVLQFFGLPDYNFEPMSVPSWVFDKCHWPLQHRPGTASDSTGQGACGVAGMAQPSKSRVKEELDQCDTHLPAAVREGGIVGVPMMGPRMSFGAKPTLRSEAQGDVSVGKQALRLKDEDAQEMADAAVHQYLAHSRRPHSKDTDDIESFVNSDILEGVLTQPPSTDDLEGCEAVPVDRPSWHSADELPCPPDDSGFFKVPRSHDAGPTITAPVHLPMEQAQHSCVDLPSQECKVSWMSGLCSIGALHRGLTTQELITVAAQPETEQAAVWRRWAGPPIVGSRPTQASIARRGSTKPVMAFSPREDTPEEEPEPELEKEV